MKPHKFLMVPQTFHNSVVRLHHQAVSERTFFYDTMLLLAKMGIYFQWNVREKREWREGGFT